MFKIGAYFFNSLDRDDIQGILNMLTSFAGCCTLVEFKSRVTLDLSFRMNFVTNYSP